MLKRPIFRGPAPGIADLSQDTAHRHMMRVGLNTGNMLFAAAAMEVLAPQEGPATRRLEPETLKSAAAEGFDCIVVTAANWLQPRTDLGPLADAIEASGLPAFVIGLGAQSGSRSIYPDLSAGTRRFLSVVAERSHSISVRGAFTADTLAHYGITTADPTGCPSLLMMDGGAAVLRKSTAAPEKITICGSRGLPNQATLESKSPTHRLSRLFAQLLQRDDVEFLAQAEIPEIYLILKGLCQDEPVKPEWIDFIEQYYGLPIGQLEPLLQARMKVFFTIPGWLDYLSGRDFVVGTRLHGVIAGLLAGTPSVLITHDSRTREMADTMIIPSVEAKDIGEGLDYAGIYAAADFDRFNARYASYYSRFRMFFENNGLAHRLRADV